MPIINHNPAFPTTDYYDEKPNGISRGMELRDYFAAKAMHAELVSSGSVAESAMALVRAAAEAGQTLEERVAVLSYQMADAMMVARAACFK